MEKMICFDMDGTIADFYNEINWLNDLISEKVNPYVNATPLYDMKELRNILLNLKAKGWKVAVISWTAKNSSLAYHEKVREAKKDWLKRYNFPADYIHLVKYGTTKAKAVKKKSDYAILIDDNEKVLQGWSLGEKINPTKENLIEKLRALA